MRAVRYKLIFALGISLVFLLKPFLAHAAYDFPVFIPVGAVDVDFGYNMKIGDEVEVHCDLPTGTGTQYYLFQPWQLYSGSNGTACDVATGKTVSKWIAVQDGPIKIRGMFGHSSLVITDILVNGKSISIAYQTPPPVLTGEPDAKSIRLSWTSEPPHEYRLYFGGLKIYEGSNSSFLHQGLQPNTSYFYRVEAKNSYGKYISSEILEIKTREPPEEKPIIITVDKVGHDQISIKWDKVSEIYDLFFDGKKITLTNNSYVFRDLDPNTTYQVKVAYVDQYGRYIESSTIDITTVAPPPPVLPVLKATNVKDDSLRLTWNMTGVSYKVYKDGVLIAEPTTIFYQVNGLSDETEYSFQVFAIDQYGRENPSNLLNVKTQKTPPPPTPRPPTQPPPPVSDTGNKDLDNANDHLVEGAKDTKNSAMVLIYIVIAIFIIIFGIWWLLRVFKRKMTKAAVSKASGSAGGAAAAKPPPKVNVTMRKPTSVGTSQSLRTYKPKKTGQGPSRRKYHVEKSYRKRH